jgi:hypothetical protein
MANFSVSSVYVAEIVAVITINTIPATFSRALRSPANWIPSSGAVSDKFSEANEDAEFGGSCSWKI